jgi:hypothetical protein
MQKFALKSLVGMIERLLVQARMRDENRVSMGGNRLFWRGRSGRPTPRSEFSAPHFL